MEDIHKAAQTANTHTHTKNCVTEHISSKHDRDIIRSENNEPILLLFIFLKTWHQNWLCFTSHNSCFLESTLVPGQYLFKTVSLRPSNPLGPVLVNTQGTAFNGTTTLCVLDRNLRRSKWSKFTTCLQTQIPTVLTKYTNDKRRGIVYKLFQLFNTLR
jgi:hypothetical protein